jgi:phage shock protein A
VRSGQNDRAHTALRAVRAERIRVVLEILGSEAVDQILQDVKRAHTEAAVGVTQARTAGRDVFRLERMLDTARDLYSRASQAFTRGDAATALDLGSHAATLVNSIRIALSAD